MELSLALMFLSHIFVSCAHTRRHLKVLLATVRVFRAPNVCHICTLLGLRLSAQHAQTRCVTHVLCATTYQQAFLDHNTRRRPVSNFLTRNARIALPAIGAQSLSCFRVQKQTTQRARQLRTIVNVLQVFMQVDTHRHPIASAYHVPFTIHSTKGSGCMSLHLLEGSTTIGFPAICSAGLIHG